MVVTEIVDGMRNQIGRLMVLGGFAAAIGVGMGIGLGPGQAEARITKPIVVGPEECDPMAFNGVPGVVVVCREEDEQP